MTEIVKVTGSLFDISQRPLKGTVSFTAEPSYILDQPEDAIFSGTVKAPLDNKGAISIDLIVSHDWKYLVEFDLTTQDGLKVNLCDVYAQFPTGGALPDFILVDAQPGSNEPVLIFTNANDGTVTVSGARLDPADPGAIIIPVSQ